VKWDEQAQRLRRKAAIDEQAMIILIADASSADEVIFVELDNRGQRLTSGSDDAESWEKKILFPPYDASPTQASS